MDVIAFANSPLNPFPVIGGQSGPVHSGEPDKPASEVRAVIQVADCYIGSTSDGSCFEVLASAAAIVVWMTVLVLKVMRKLGIGGE